MTSQSSAGLQKAMAFGMLLSAPLAAQFASLQPNTESLRQAWIDFDRDGLQDLYTVAPGRADVLLRNLGDGQFTDVSAQAGLVQLHSRAAQVVDLNNDQQPELLLVREDGSVALFESVAGRFQNTTQSAGLGGVQGATTARGFDYDADGWVDLYLETQGGTPALFHNREGLFQRVALELPEVATAAPGSPSAPAATASDAATSTKAPTDTVSGSVNRPDTAGGSRSGKIARSDAPSNRVPVDVSIAQRSIELGSVNPTIGSVDAIGAPFCAVGVKNTGGSGCILANNTPTLGQLYPQTSQLNVTGGNVNIGNTASTAFDLNVSGDTKSLGTNGPTNGYLGVQGANSFDGVLSTLWSGLEIGVAGISTGGSLADNYGVIGHATFGGVRGEHSDDPTVDFGVLGAENAGLIASGSTAGGRFLNDIHMETSSGQVNMDIDEDNVGGASISAFDNNGTLSFFFDSDWANLQAPRMEFFNGSSGILGIDLDVGLSDAGGTIKVAADDGGTSIELDGNNGAAGSIEMFNDAGVETFEIFGDSGGASFVSLRNSSGITRINLDGDSAGGAFASFLAADSSTTVVIDGESTNSGGLVSVRNDIGQETVGLIGDGVTGGQGSISMWDRTAGNNSVVINARDSAGTGSEIVLLNQDGNIGFDLDAGGGTAAIMFLRETDGSSAMEFVSNDLTLRNAAGTSTINFDRVLGTKSAVVSTPSYGQRQLYTMESPEIWLEDFGTANLQEGQVRIDVDPMFLETATVNPQHPMKVFVTPNGETEGLFVEKHDTYFVVREQNGGTSTVSFDWRLVVKRKGLEDFRLNEFEEPVLAGDIAATPFQANIPDDSVAEIDEEPQYAEEGPTRQEVAPEPVGIQTKSVK